MQFSNTHPMNIAHLLKPYHLLKLHEESVFTECILSGDFGTITLDNCDPPQAALLSYADVIIPIGNANQPGVIDLIQSIPLDKGIITKDTAWKEKILDVLAKKTICLERYSFSNENLNPNHLRRLSADIPPGYTLKRIDYELAERLTIDPPPLTRDHIFNFGTIQRFLELGFGCCILQEQEIVSAASTYAVSKSGIEIQVNTVESQRGKGLAMLVSANLVLESLDRKLQPHWDAANKTSAGLAERLGFTPQGSYEMIVRVET
jgi:hypothetical protein